jgi:hypothetical protein
VFPKSITAGPGSPPSRGRCAPGPQPVPAARVHPHAELLNPPSACPGVLLVCPGCVWSEYPFHRHKHDADVGHRLRLPWQISLYNGRTREWWVRAQTCDESCTLPGVCTACARVPAAVARVHRTMSLNDVHDAPDDECSWAQLRGRLRKLRAAIGVYIELGEEEDALEEECNWRQLFERMGDARELARLLMPQVRLSRT